MDEGPCRFDDAELGIRSEHPLVVRLPAFMHSLVAGVTVTTEFSVVKVHSCSLMYAWRRNREK